MVLVEFNRRKQLREVSPHANRSHHTPGTSTYINNYPTAQATSSSGYQQRVITNPYKQANGAPKNAPTYIPSNDKRGKNNDAWKMAANETLPYASDMMRGMTSDSRQDHPDREAQHPHRGGRVRNQRQFGTSIGVSIGSAGMKDELRRCITAFAPGFTQPGASSSKDNQGMNHEENALSDISSTSSDDEGLLSFDVFGKK